jgi:hypothetical protein
MELVEIKSKYLKFASWGFEWIENGGFGCRVGSDNPNIRPCETVLVNPVEFEKMAIQQIKKLIPSAGVVVKVDGVVCVHSCNPYIEDDLCYFECTIDIQPWNESYNIDV